jgi:hypothetical protein
MFVLRLYLLYKCLVHFHAMQAVYEVLGVYRRDVQGISSPSALGISPPGLNMLRASAPYIVGQALQRLLQGALLWL